MPEELCASVKRMPSLASLSKNGVENLASGFWQAKSPYPMSSAYMMIILGRSAARMVADDNSQTTIERDTLMMVFIDLGTLFIRVFK